jgi:hypothetical protein
VGTVLLAIGPFVVGGVCGILLAYAATLWAFDVKTLIALLGGVAFASVALAILIWLIARVVLGRPANSLLSRIQDVIADIDQNADLLEDPSFFKTRILPLAPAIAKLVLGWLSVAGAMGLALALVANVTLMATLAVQYLQVDRLEAQNRLIVVQSQAAKIEQERELLKDIQQAQFSLLELDNLKRWYESYPYLSKECSSGRSEACDADFFSELDVIIDFGPGKRPYTAQAVNYLSERHEAYAQSTAQLRKSPESLSSSHEVAELVFRPAAVSCGQEPPKTREVMRLGVAIRAVEVAAADVVAHLPRPQAKEAAAVKPADMGSKEKRLERMAHTLERLSLELRGNVGFPARFRLKELDALWMQAMTEMKRRVAELEKTCELRRERLNALVDDLRRLGPPSNATGAATPK